MKKALFVMPVLALMVSCSQQDLVYGLTHIGTCIGATLSVKNEGRFTMAVGAQCRGDPRLVGVGQTAVFKTFGDNLSVDTTVRVGAYYSDPRLGNWGSWTTSVPIHQGDNISLTIPDCPGRAWLKPGFGSVTYGNGLFAALASNKVLWSRDGTTGSWKASEWVDHQWYYEPLSPFP